MDQCKDFDIYSYLVGEKRGTIGLSNGLQILQNTPIFNSPKLKRVLEVFHTLLYV